MTEAQVEIAYDGNAVADGSMDIRDFAPALLALGGLIQSANQELNANSAHVDVKVKLDEKPGSFPFRIEVVQSLAQQISAGVSGVEPVSAAQLLVALGIVGAAVGGVAGFVELVKAFRGGAIKEIEQDGDGNAIVRGDNNQTLIAQPGAVVLYQSPQVRREASKIVAPLRKPGIDSLEVREGGRVVRQIASREDLRSFAALRADANVEGDTGEFVDWVTIRKLWTTPRDRKWQLALSNGSPINAKVTDETFWDELEAGRYNLSSTHAKLHVRIEWEESGGDFNYTIVEVLGYLRPEPPNTQRHLDMPEKPDAE